ncbi:MAG TPA: DUF3795 domain-containing protein [Anaerolineae bacterium]|nr:DUF3795 domain-containing protein [Anaerolineae bacterium]HPL29020.1 DUF3795 domain-containing protein [Anaerolineae bacterium]
MLGYCGIHCDECRGFRGTVGGDMALLESLAERFGNAPRDWVCLGCQPAQQPFLATFCAGCAIRACAVARELPNCAACGDYEGCTRLHDFIQAESEQVVRTMALLRERFLRGQAGQKG